MVESTEIIRLLSNFSVLLPITVYCLKFKILPRHNHIIGMLVIASMIFDLTGFIRAKNGLSTVILFNTYFLLQQLLLTLFYYKILFNNVKHRVFPIGIAFFVVGYIFITLFAQGINEYQSYVWTLGCVILAVYGLLFTSHLLKNNPAIDSHFQSKLFINGGIVVYASFSFFLFIIDQYLLSLEPEITGGTWTFHNINNIVKNIAFAIGLWFTGKSTVGLTEQQSLELKKKYPEIK